MIYNLSQQHLCVIWAKPCFNQKNLNFRYNACQAQKYDVSPNLFQIEDLQPWTKVWFNSVENGEIGSSMGWYNSQLFLNRTFYHLLISFPNWSCPNVSMSKYVYFQIYFCPNVLCQNVFMLKCTTSNALLLSFIGAGSAQFPHFLSISVSAQQNIIHNILSKFSIHGIQDALSNIMSKLHQYPGDTIIREMWNVWMSSWLLILEQATRHDVYLEVHYNPDLVYGNVWKCNSVKHYAVYFIWSISHFKGALIFLGGKSWDFVLTGRRGDQLLRSS